MPELIQDRLEVERVINLVQGFGWEKVSEELTDEHIEMKIRKKRAVVAPETGAGPS